MTHLCLLLIYFTFHKVSQTDTKKVHVLQPWKIYEGFFCFVKIKCYKSVYGKTYSHSVQCKQQLSSLVL